MRIPNWLKRHLPFLGWMHLLDRSTLRNDVMAGITAGVLILPQAIALATIAGMPPEYGLYTAIFPVIITGLFGSAYQSLSGPNTALVVLIAMTVAPFANIGAPDYIQYVITLTFMMGVIQLIFGFLRLGTIFNYFSHTVMVAIVTGVGVIIIVQQCGNFLGVLMNMNEDLQEILWQVWIAFERANWYAFAAGVVTVVVGLGIRRYRPKWPHYIISVIVGALFVQILNMIFGASNVGVDMLGHLSLSALPLSAPDFSPDTFAEFANFAYPAAIGMAVLGLMQTAVIARSVTAKTGQQGVDVNQETISQGLSNVVGSFLSCFGSCGSFNRSAANLEAGAKTPLAGIVSAFALAGLVVLAAPLITYLPIPVMAGVLFMVGAALIKIGEIRHLMLTKGLNRIVFVVVLLTTLFSGVDDGVYLGIFLSIVGYLRGMSKPSVETLIGLPKENFLLEGMESEQTTAISISGSLFFGSVPHFEKELSNIAAEDHRQHNLLIVATFLNGFDISGASAMAQEAQRRRANGYKVGIWLREDLLKHDSQVTEVLKNGFGADNVKSCDLIKTPASNSNGIVATN